MHVVLLCAVAAASSAAAAAEPLPAANASASASASGPYASSSASLYVTVVVMEKHGPIRAYVQRRFERLWRPLSELVGLAADSFISDEQVMAVVADRLKTEIEGSLQNLGIRATLDVVECDGLRLVNRLTLTRFSPEEIDAFLRPAEGVNTNAFMNSSEQVHPIDRLIDLFVFWTGGALRRIAWVLHDKVSESPMLLVTVAETLRQELPQRIRVALEDRGLHGARVFVTDAPFDFARPERVYWSEPVFSPVGVR